MRIQLIRYHDVGNINTRLAESLNTRQGILPPLGIAYIASALEQAKHEVEIIDAIAMKLTAQEVRGKISSFAPQVVGITAMTPTFKGVQEAALIAKAEGAITVIGGVHMSIFPKETLTYDYIDFGIIGEAEESMVELCNALENKQPIENIEGLVFKKADKVFQNSSRIINNINSLPIPAYHLLPMKKYSSIIGMHPVSTMIGTRGCPYKCGFCYKTPSDKKIRSRDPKFVVDEMEFLIKNYKIKEVMFYDDIMLPKYATALSEEIIKRKLDIKWQTPQRIDLVKPELLKLMANAGCHLLRYGVEQGDPLMMSVVEKRLTINKIKEAFKWTKQAEIESFAYFIIGYIKETDSTMQATIDLAKELDPQYVMFTKAIPLPNTPLMDMAVAQGLMEEDYWRKFTLGEEVKPIPPLVLNVDMFIKKAYRSFYLRPWKMLKQLSRIKTPKDLINNITGLIGLIRF